MENTSKLIRKNIPSYSKWAIGIIISAFVGNYLLPSLFNWKPLVLPDGMIPSLIITFGLILISVLISSIKTVSELRQKFNLIENKKPNAYVIEPIKKKKLPDYIDLKSEVLNGFEYKIKVIRCFYTDDKPGLEKFLQVIRIKDVLCSECKSDISLQTDSDYKFSHTSPYVYTCTNKVCVNHNKKGLVDYKYKEFLNQSLTQAKSEIRKDFNKYWDLYVKSYKTLTEGKYEEYAEPIGFYDTQYYK